MRSTQKEFQFRAACLLLPFLLLAPSIRADDDDDGGGRLAITSRPGWFAPLLSVDASAVPGVLILKVRDYVRATPIGSALQLDAVGAPGDPKAVERDFRKLNDFFADDAVSLAPVFSVAVDDVEYQEARSACLCDIPDPNDFFRVGLRNGISAADTERLIKRLMALKDAIEIAYPDRIVETSCPTCAPTQNLAAAPNACPSAESTGDQSDGWFQAYRGPASRAGMDVDWATTAYPTGADGVHATAVLLEYRFPGDEGEPQHDDLPNLCHSTTSTLSHCYKYHAASTIGLIAARRDGIGTSGIVPEAFVLFVAPQAATGSSIAAAIADVGTCVGSRSTVNMSLGVALNWSAPPPPTPAGTYNFPIEILPEVRTALQLNSYGKGILFVQSAANNNPVVGNSSRAGIDLDQVLCDPTNSNALCDTPGATCVPCFSRQWDSGAVLVGAGAPYYQAATPPSSVCYATAVESTPGRYYFCDSDTPFANNSTSYAPNYRSFLPLSRLDYSNFGSRVDVQAWGGKLAAPTYYESPCTPGNPVPVNSTCGTPAPTDDRTNQFWGTSASAALITGVATQIQSVVAERLGPAIPPLLLRSLLKTYALPQRRTKDRLAGGADVPITPRGGRHRTAARRELGHRECAIPERLLPERSDQQRARDPRPGR